MKRVAIVTWTKWNNYGTVLQSFALYKFIENLGFQVRVLDDSLISSTYCIKHYGKTTKVNIFKIKVRSFFQKKDLKKKVILQREKKFIRFKRRFIKYYRKNVNYNNLYRLDRKFDFFVCGSDQIWTPDERFFDPYYFLSFVKSKKKIAYAPSIGVAEYHSDKIELLKEMVSSFDSLSIREETGKNILEAITDKSIQVLLDPTMLFTGEEWARMFGLIRSKQKEKYVLCYYLGESQWYRDEVTKICNDMRLKMVVLPCLEEDILHNTNLSIPDPIEFLNLILNAEYVFTDSFHGCIFSILFHKNFYIFQRFSDKDAASQNSRVKDLCYKLGLNDRYIYQQGKLNLNEKNNINYNLVDSLIEPLRFESTNYLARALGKLN